MNEMDSDNTDICGKCDNTFKKEHKAVSCFTCKQLFHIQCQGVSDTKYEFLSNQSDNSGIVWFCRACKRTTSGMFQHIANLEIRLKSIETERQKEKHEMSVLQNLVNALNKKINSLDESVGDIQEQAESNGEQMDTIKDAVTCMLREVPQTTSIEARFASIEDSLKQVSSLPSNESRSITWKVHPLLKLPMSWMIDNGGRGT